MKAQNKSFDCVEMKHQIQSLIYKKTKKMTPEEEIKYFNEKAQEWLKKQALKTQH